MSADLDSFPCDCVQIAAASGKWWVPQDSPKICRGSLVTTFIAHADQLPYTFVPASRTDATKHDSATVTVEPLKVNQPLKRIQLPVAAMTAYDGETWAAYRAKKRPCLVLSCDHPAVDAALTRGMPKTHTAPMCLAAPYYGIARNRVRVGFNDIFVERVRHLEFPQFFWDALPHPSGEESILRLDQLQPVGAHHQAVAPTGFRLCDDGLSVIDEILEWLIRGDVREDSLVAMFRSEIEQALA